MALTPGRFGFYDAATTQVKRGVLLSIYTDKHNQTLS